MKKAILLFIIPLILNSCKQSANENNENALDCIKTTNIQLKSIVDDCYKDYLSTPDNGSDIELLKEDVDSCNHYIEDIEKNNVNAKRFIEIKDWLKEYKKDGANILKVEITETELGRQLLINKILSYELSIITYFKKSQMLSFFQTDMVKLVPVKDTIPYAKNIQLNIETKYSCRSERVKIIYQGDTIFDNQNIFSIKYSNPKRGENILKVPFILKRWGEETQFDSVEVKFYVK